MQSERRRNIVDLTCSPLTFYRKRMSSTQAFQKPPSPRSKAPPATPERKPCQVSCATQSSDKIYCHCLKKQRMFVGSGARLLAKLRIGAVDGQKYFICSKKVKADRCKFFLKASA